MKSGNVIAEKTMAFAIRIVNAYRLLQDRKEFVMSKQLLRAGTSIGANVHEGAAAQTKADFIAKCSISLKECNETAYWLELLHKTEYLKAKEYESIRKDCSEIFAILTSIIKTARSRL